MDRGGRWVAERDLRERGAGLERGGAGGRRPRGGSGLSDGPGSSRRAGTDPARRRRGELVPPRSGFGPSCRSSRESYEALTRIVQRSIAPILLLGPTGSGKEVLAREVHARSGRPGPFVAVNCGALPPALVESLLFGHLKGAFSGAERDEPGFLRAAERGTLLLDEIGDLPPSSQAALLRVLQEKEVVPVGATRALKVDVRIVAATHRPLPELIASGAFRADLLARLKGYSHRLPSLRERMPDFGVLLADVLEQIAKANKASAEKLTLMPDAGRALLAYDWPLNIRELYQTMGGMVALAADNVLEARHLPAEILPRARPPRRERRRRGAGRPNRRRPPRSFDRSAPRA